MGKLTATGNKRNQAVAPAAVKKASETKQVVMLRPAKGSPLTPLPDFAIWNGDVEKFLYALPSEPIFKKHGLQLRNRIIWHFGHGLNNKRRFSGRYETVMWYTKSDDYVFHLDAVRVPAKYPGKKPSRDRTWASHPATRRARTPRMFGASRR